MIVEVSKERTRELIEKVALFFAERRMGAPALLFLESMRPLSFVGSQIMYFLAPFANVLLSGNEFEEFAAVMSDRENVQLLIQRIDELDEKLNEERRKAESIKRQKFWNKIKKFFKKSPSPPVVPNSVRLDNEEGEDIINESDDDNTTPEDK